MMHAYPNIKGLLGAYGFELQEEYPSECKARFQGESTFIDLWIGRRGITLGIYDPRKKTMRYHYRMSESKIENALIEAQKLYV